MANEIELVVPTLTTPGPDYASQVSDDLTTIATHDHDGVNNGTTIDIAAQDCNEDLSLDSHNLSNVRSVELNNLPAQLTGSQDVNCIYVLNNNLGFNNDEGIFVPLTNGNVIAVTSLPLTNFTPRSSTVTSTFSILHTDTYNLIDLDSSGGSFTGTLPIAAAITPLAPGRLYLFRDVSGACGAHPITIQVTPASGNLFEPGAITSITLNNEGAYVAIYTDGISNWFVWSQNVYNDEYVSFIGTAITLTSNTTISADSTVVDIRNGGGLVLNAGATCIFQGGSLLEIQDTSKIQLSGTAQCTFANGTNCTFISGSTLALGSGSTTTCSGQINLGGTLTYSGALNGSPTDTSIATIASVRENLGTNVVCGETFATRTVSSNYTCDSGGTFLDRYLSLQLTASSAFTVTLPPTPSAGRLITIADGTSVNPQTAPGYAITISGNGINIANFLSNTGGTVASLAISSTGATGPPVSPSVVSSGWAVTFIYTGSIWALQSSTFNISSL